MIKTYLHVDALRKLQKPYDFTVVDEYVTQNVWDNYLQRMQLTPVKIDVMVPKAESQYLAVACASMIARYYFLNQIAKQNAKWQMVFALGGWNKKVETAILQFLKKYPIENLKQVTKLHFKNLEKIIEKV